MVIDSKPGIRWRKSFTFAPSAFKYGDGGTVNPEEPWAALPNSEVKSWIGANGLFYKEAIDAYTGSGYMPLAYVVYVSDERKFLIDPNSRADKGDYYAGLAIGLFKKEYEGQAIDNVEKDITAISTDHYGCRFFVSDLSRWFIPTADNWKFALKEGFGFEFNDDGVIEDEHAWQTLHDALGIVENSYLDGPYRTLQPLGGKGYSCINFAQGEQIKIIPVGKTDTELGGKKIRYRPMIAFK